MNWVMSFAGGLMIGAAAMLLYALAGRIAGVSGVLYGGVWGERAERAERGWRLLFLAGLIAGGWLAALAGVPVSTIPWSLPAAMLTGVAGLLVGFGTRMGNGCTSGHGVCGLGRLSPRSLAAVIVFMATGAAVATLLRPWLI